MVLRAPNLCTLDVCWDPKKLWGHLAWPSPSALIMLTAQSLVVACLSCGHPALLGTPPGMKRSLPPASICFKVLFDCLATFPHNPHATSHVELAHARMLCVLGAMTPSWVSGCLWGGGVMGACIAPGRWACLALLGCQSEMLKPQPTLAPSKYNYL